MAKTKYLHGLKLNRFRSMELWISKDSKSSTVYSYVTKIGYINWKTNVFYTWGYGKYSQTTSRQITIMCNHYGLKRIDIEQPQN